MKRRIVSVLTALALMLSLCPTWALAAEADPSLCKHHEAHTEDCGYTAPTEGHDCGHEHTAACYTLGVLPDADSGDPYQVGGDTENLLDCHHSHDSACGYVQADPGTPCGYGCRICPVEELIAALPEKVTEENRADVEARLQEILALLEELPEEQQDLVDITPCLALQEQLDAAGAASPLAEGDGTAEHPWLCGAEGNNLTAVLSDDKATLTISGTGAMANYFGDGAPWHTAYNTITKVELPEGLTTIGDSAFSNMTALRQITIPNTVTSIGSSAFSSCNMKEVSIPEGVKTIGAEVFTNSNLESVVLPASVTQVGAYAFNSCKQLQRLTVQGETKLMRGAFNGCSKLNTITFSSKTPPSISTEVFSGCSALATISVPHGCKAAYQTALADSGISNLESIITAPEKHEWNDDGSCACGAQAVAVRRIFGNTTTTTFLENAEELINAFTPDESALPVDISLLKAVKISRPITIRGSGFGQFRLSGRNWPITYTGDGAALRIESGDVTLSTCKIDGKQRCVAVSGGTVDISDSTFNAAGNEDGGGQGVYIGGGNVTIATSTCSGMGNSAAGVEIQGGAVTIAGGTFSGAGGDNAAGVKVGQNGTATIKGGSFSGTDGYDASGLRVFGEADISGGVFTGSYYGVYNAGNTTISGGTFSSESHPLGTNGSFAGMLATDCAYYRDNKPIKVDNGLSPGTVTVRKCGHPGAEVADNGDGTHSVDCPYCGGSYSHDTVLKAEADPATNTVTLTGGCNTEGCGYSKELGTVSFTFENLVYGNPNAKVSRIKDGPASLGVMLKIDNAGDYAIQGEDTAYSYSLIDLFASTPMTAGDHTLKMLFYDDSNIMSTETVECELPFTVAKAPLTPSIIGTATKTYDGTTNCDGTGLPIALDGVVNGDTVTATAKSYAYDSPNAGERTITATGITLGGADADNYTLSSTTATTTGTITKSQPTIAFVSGYNPSKDYDGQTIPNPTADNLTITDATFRDVTFAWSNPPKDAGTYTLTATIAETNNTEAASATLPVTISPKAVTADSTNITLTPSEYEFNGAECKPAVVIKDGGLMIPAREYEVSYSGNINVGTATVTITDNPGGNYTVSGTTTFAITAKPLTGAKVEVTGTFTYTGNAQTPTPIVTLDGKTLTENTDYTVAYDKNTDAGTATITVTGKGNYSGTAQGTFTIGRATLTADGTGTASGTYGDKLSELTVSGLTAKLGEATVTGTWKLAGGTVPNVGDSGDYTATFTPATGADNYNALEAKVTLNIAQATAPTPQTGTLNVQNGHAREYTYDLSCLLPVLASGQSFGGEVTYTLKTVNITEAGYYDSDTAVISGTTLTLPVKAVTSSDEGQIGTITVTITSKNFADVDATINVNRVNKQPVSIEGVTAQNGIYNGESHNGYTGTPTASPYSGGFTVTYAKADGTALSGPPTDAGDYTVTISLNPNDTYTGSRTLSFTISKASITIKADDKRADVGAAKPALTYTVTGLVSGDTLATAPTLACDADMDTIGQYPITASGAAVPSGGNYNTAITYVPGTLSVTDPTIPVTGVTLNKTSLGLTVGGSERLTATVTPSDATDKSVTWASSNTAVATVDANGTVTAVSAGTATITVTTADGAKTAACTVTVRTNGNGGGSYVPSGPGSSTVTVPVSGDKGTVHVSASVSGTTATVSKIDTSQIENVIGDNGQASMVEIDFTGLGKTIDTVKLPAAAIKDIAAKAQNEEVGGLTVKLPEAEISFDAKALSAIQAQARDQITLTVTPAKPTDLNNRQKEAVGSAPVFDLTLRSSSGAITDFRGGYATVSLPYTLAAGQNPSGVVVYYLDSTGNITPCTTMYDVRSKSAIFTTGHLSLYFVGYDPAAVWVNPFSDVAEGAWYYDAVRYASENGLMGGYGNGKFGPNDNLSRAQFAQILFNKEGRPVVNYLLRYNDVADGAWYTEAVRWATSQGVVSGYGNGMFGPNDNITREQLAVMLWRYAGSPAATDKELHFTDTDKASGFALEALRWAVENGVMGGYGDGRLDPKGLATRAQVAQMLKNYLEK